MLTADCGAEVLPASTAISAVVRVKRDSMSSDIEAVDSVNDAQPRADRPLGIVLMRSRVTEIGQDAVAHVLSDAARCARQAARNRCKRVFGRDDGSARTATAARVRRKRACAIIDIGMTKLYELFGFSIWPPSSTTRFGGNAKELGRACCSTSG